MTTLSSTYSRPANPRPFLFLSNVAILLMAVAMPTVLAQSHANKHPEADQIRKCLQQNGPAMVYKLRDTFYFPCQLPNGKWGFQAAVKDKILGWVEKTAFSKDSGTLAEFRAYMGRLGATPWKGPLP